jgi:hypothetical protein
MKNGLSRIATENLVLQRAVPCDSRFMESADDKRFIAHEDHEPLRNGRARSPLRAADGR